MSAPESSKLMKPRSNKWSMLGVNNSPFPIEPLVIRRIPPGLAVARDEVSRVVDCRDPASPLNLHNALLEQALPAPGPNDRLPIGVSDRGIRGHPLFQSMLPNIKVVARFDLVNLAVGIDSDRRG
jgi:hypothetical protein